MRKITAQATAAFLSAQEFSSSNTEVKTFQESTVLYLHGNRIATNYKDKRRGLYIRAAGWSSNTTKERLNALPGVSIQQKKGVWFLNGKEWDGSEVRIKQ